LTSNYAVLEMVRLHLMTRIRKCNYNKVTHYELIDPQYEPSQDAKRSISTFGTPAELTHMSQNDIINQLTIGCNLIRYTYELAAKG
jgi:hypothetical protein